LIIKIVTFFVGASSSDYFAVLPVLSVSLP
jgi:hypothetical protein